jgi:hypothetical protein
MKCSQASITPRLIVALALAASLLAACDGQGDDAKTPPPTATWTPAPTNAVILPAVEGGGGPAGDRVSPLATPDSASPLASPTPTAAP